ncbi:hypothetical protein MtrunA17_Chr1g0157121 [Medicago truncatula]|uniref:Transmembrane protein n=1 Tax=Medicago truncatula TaxID=3880 RepID=A0A396JSL5_MEDTR|nr:hypothetical protein MtrunA17_Chr1g0157121 [Medicago truncatula]
MRNVIIYSSNAICTYKFFFLFAPIVHRKVKKRERGKRLGFHLSHNYVVNFERKKRLYVLLVSMIEELIEQVKSLSSKWFLAKKSVTLLFIQLIFYKSMGNFSSIGCGGHFLVYFWWVKFYEKKIYIA